MFFKITEISYDGAYWFRAEQPDGIVVEADNIVQTHPMEGVKAPKMPTRDF